MVVIQVQVANVQTICDRQNHSQQLFRCMSDAALGHTVSPGVREDPHVGLGCDAAANGPSRLVRSKAVNWYNMWRSFVAHHCHIVQPTQR